MRLGPSNPALAVLAALEGVQREPERGRAAATAIALLTADQVHAALSAAGDSEALLRWSRLVSQLIEVREHHLPSPK